MKWILPLDGSVIIGTPLVHLKATSRGWGKKCGETLVIKIDPALRPVPQLPAPTSSSEVSVGHWT